MLDFKRWAQNLFKSWYFVKEQNLTWQTAHQEQLLQLKQAEVLAQKHLESQLKIRTLELEQQLALLQETHAAQLSMHKTKCKQDIKDYQQYLEALDELKTMIQKTYTHLPSAVAFTIHHHAKLLLNTMWDAKNVDEKMQRELQLIRFMSTVHEDARVYLEGSSQQQLPENTLKLIHAA